MARIPSGGSELDPSRTIQSSQTVEGIPVRRQPRRREGIKSDEVIIYFKGGVVVTFWVTRARTNEPSGEVLYARWRTVD